MALTDASLLSGTLDLEVQHSLPAEVQLLYQVPGIVIDGVPLSIPLLLPPASDVAPGVSSSQVDLAGATFDFTGLSGQETNALEVTIVATSGAIDNDEGFFIITETDSVVVSLGFQSLALETLGGYFGTLTESTSADVELLDTIPLPEPVIDLEGTVPGEPLAAVGHEDLKKPPALDGNIQRVVGLGQVALGEQALSGHYP